MIRIDAIWLATEPTDMRAGTETAQARVVTVFDAANPHCVYLFANRRAIPTAGLLAHVMVAKFADHLPLYRQEKIFARAGWPSRDQHWLSG